MLRLKDRNHQIPGGFVFYLPELKWSAPKNYPSFRVVCDSLQAVVKANPFLASKHQWPTDRESIENWVDSFNATVCSRMGWSDYITPSGGGASSLPKSPSPEQTLPSLTAAAARAKELLSGAKTLLEWDDSGEPPVSLPLAEKRAEVCAPCPLNQAGDWTRWFTTPAAELIKRRVAKAHQRGLTTPLDEQLHLCTACHCPLQVKVHIPLPWITKRLSPEQFQRLRQAPGCWIIREMES